MSEQRFEAVVESRPRGAIAVRVPFDPSAVWGVKDCHYVTGSMGGRSLRGRLIPDDEGCFLQLGPAWNYGRFRDGDRAPVSLVPEGPQLETMAPDFGEALASDPDARRFFESLATFYRKGYLRWIESAKRPETRARRIAEAVAALKAGQRER